MNANADLALRDVVCSYTISLRLSGLKRLSQLALEGTRVATYNGGIERVPALRMLSLPGFGASGAPLKSAALRCLLTRGLNVRRPPSPLYHVCT